MEPKAIKHCIAAVVFIAAVSRAATPFTEPFTGGLSGWVGTNSLAVPSNLTVVAWMPTNNYAQTTFAPAGGPPPIEYAALVATGTASAGAFTGDYTSASTLLMGFDFQAVSALPSELRINIFGSTNVFSHDFYTIPLTNVVSLQTGVWYKLRVTLANTGLGRLYGSDFSTLPATLADIRRVEVYVRRSGTVGQTYLVDNIFLDRLPTAQSVSAGTGGVTIVWTGLRTNLSYRAQAINSVTNSAWNLQEAFVATGATHVVTDTNLLDAVRSYRLTID